MERAETVTNSTRNTGIPAEELHERIKKLKVRRERLHLGSISTKTKINCFDSLVWKEEVMSGEIQAKISRRKISDESVEQRLKKTEALNAKGNKIDANSQMRFPWMYISSRVLASL